MSQLKIKVYNSLTRKKEDFVPRDPEHVSIYVCGVTPYSQTHLGHARPSVIWDVIKRFFRLQGYTVTHVQNFTDVDDKIIERANQEGLPALAISKRYIEEYFDSMDALGVERASLYPKVSEHIDEIIDMVQTLIDGGYAYESEGNVFFHVASFPEYGKLSNQRREDLLEGTRFEVDPAKRDAADFALWKKAKPGEPAWDSPWGSGRPGWHIECSVMSHKYLGTKFDFHGGGADLIFPHHENEIAQSEAATGEPSARYWVHNGMLNLKDAKMSKSTGNFVSVEELVKRYPKELIRYYILSTHYRSTLEYYDGKLEEMSKGWRRLNDTVINLRQLMDKTKSDRELDEKDRKVLEVLDSLQIDFLEALADDFNTAMAVGVLFEIVREVNGYMSEQGERVHEAVLGKALTILEEYGGGVLGILQEDEVDGQHELVEPLIELILELREELRQEKNFSLADRIRIRLGEIGVAVEDTPQGPRWKV